MKVHLFLSSSARRTMQHKAHAELLQQKDTQQSPPHTQGLKQLYNKLFKLSFFPIATFMSSFVQATANCLQLTKIFQLKFIQIQ